jgi:sRNA-binding carbon storage regulator CsrA
MEYAMEAIKEKRLRKGGLVLERNLQESITIFDKLDGTVQPIVITLVKLRGQRASLHINATTNFGIVRTELLKGAAPCEGTK